MDQLFLNFTFVLGLATIFAIAACLFRQPLIVAYIFAGVVLATFGGQILHQFDVFRLLPEIGIVFLLFLIGMELDFREMAKVGRAATTSASIQMLLSGMAGFAIARVFGLPEKEAVYAGIGLSFSSTIMVIKLLADQKEEASLHGRMAVGILLIEDLVAIVILMMLSLSNSFFSLNFTNNLPIFALLVKATIFFSTTIYLSRKALPSLFGYIAHSMELLLLSAIVFCFAWVTLAQVLGFSLEIGAFLAGLALASSPYRLQIAGRIRPLRDLFITLFFIDLGAQVNIAQVFTAPLLFFLLTTYAVLVKPVIFSLVLGFLGYKKHSTFLTSINLTQISEFSLIVLLAGKNHGLVSDSTLSTFALVAAVSFVISSLLITHSKKLYTVLLPLVSLFEREKTINLYALTAAPAKEYKNHIVIVGCHRSGGKVVEYIAQKQADNLVAIDFNPDVVKKLSQQGIQVVFGDIADPEILDEVNIKEAKLIISTIRDFEDNQLLLIEARKRKKDTFIIMAAETEEEARELEKHGVNKVVMPLALEGQHIINYLSREWFPKNEK